MTSLYCEYVSTEYCDREPDLDDPWDAGDYSGTYSVTGVRLSPGFRDRCIRRGGSVVKGQAA